MSETLNPDPVTELPLTPPAEEDEEEAAISPRSSLKEQKRAQNGVRKGVSEFPRAQSQRLRTHLMADEGSQVQEETASKALGCRPRSVAPQPQSTDGWSLPCVGEAAYTRRGDGCS